MTENGEALVFNYQYKQTPESKLDEKKHQLQALHSNSQIKGKSLNCKQNILLHVYP